MIKQHNITRNLNCGILSVEVLPAGDDIAVILQGGDRPHIGCSVLAVPRPSLTGDGKVSTTSSVLNVTGHKDETICRMIAEQLSIRYNCTVVCSGGFHVDGITDSEISEVISAVVNILEEI